MFISTCDNHISNSSSHISLNSRRALFNFFFAFQQSSTSNQTETRITSKSKDDISFVAATGRLKCTVITYICQMTISIPTQMEING